MAYSPTCPYVLYAETGLSSLPVSDDAMKMTAIHTTGGAHRLTARARSFRKRALLLSPVGPV